MQKHCLNLATPFSLASWQTVQIATQPIPLHPCCRSLPHVNENAKYAFIHALQWRLPIHKHSTKALSIHPFKNTASRKGMSTRQLKLAAANTRSKQSA